MGHELVGWITGNLKPIILWVAAIITLGIYSFLYSDNKIYRLLMAIMVGVGVGYGFMVTWLETLGPKWWDRAWSAFNPHAAEHGTFFLARASHYVAQLFSYLASHPGAMVYWLVLGVLGSLWYFQLSMKRIWLARIVIGISMGAGAGVVFKQQFLQNMPQIVDSFRPLIAGGPTAKYQYGVPLGLSHGSIDLIQSLNNILYVATIVAVMTYFFFSFAHDRKGVAGTARFGRWMLMLCFGAFFGNTVMTRMSFFLQRVQFLTKEWGPEHSVLFGLRLHNIVVGLIVVAPIAILYAVYMINRPRTKPPTPDEVGEEPAGVQPGPG